MTALDIAARLIRVFEGCRLRAYQDSGRVWTIGFGHTGVKPGDSCTLDQARQWLAEDLAPLTSLVAGRSHLEAGTLLSFGYNCGADDLERVVKGALTPTPDGFVTPDGKLFGRVAGGKVVTGLDARRRLEACLILESRVESARMAWLLAHAHTIFQAPYTEGPIMMLSREAIDAAIEEAREPRETEAEW
jgi:lysozyme